MLAFLGLTASRAPSRDEIGSVVWPDAEPERAKMSVRTSLRALRLALGEDAIQADRQFIWLNPEIVRTDLASFQQFLAEAQSSSNPSESHRLLRLAVGLVKGPMLKEIEAWWLAPHQLAFEELYGQAVSKLVDSLAEFGEIDEAIAIGKNALTVTPLRQDIHIALIRTLNQAGRGDEAISQYEALESLLDEQWGEEPSQEARMALNLRTPQKDTPIATSSRLTDSDGRPVYGRERLVQQVITHLTDSAEHQIITLHGFGGVGKTTVAQLAVDSLPHEVIRAWVDLVPIRDESVLLSRLAEAVNADKNTIEALTHKLQHLCAERRLVVILDNAEHLAEATEHVLTRLCQNVPNLKCLVTSRILLGSSRELGVPTTVFGPTQIHGKLAEVLESPAVALFAARARLALPDFAVTSQNISAIVEICNSLDGLPLAIELAAAQVSVLSPAKLLLRLANSQFTLTQLIGNKGGRHSSMDRVAAESYELLNPEDQEGWRRLAVFRGSFDPETASVVTGIDHVEPMLARLTAASMLERVAEGDEVRFKFLVPLRTFALGRLTDSGELDLARSRQRCACLELATHIRPHIDGPKFAASMSEYRLWEDDILQVFDLAIRDHTGLEEAMIICERLVQFILYHGGLGGWKERITQLVAASRGHVSELSLARGLLAHGVICAFHESQWEDALASVQEAYTSFELQGSRTNTAYVCSVLGLIHLFARHYGVFKLEEAEYWLQSALSQLDNEEHSSEGVLWNPKVVKAGALSNMAWLRREQGRPEEALECLEKAMTIADQHKVWRIRPTILLGMADVLMTLDRLEEALSCAKRSIEASENLHFDSARQSALGRAVVLSLISKRFGEAYDVLERWMQSHTHARLRWGHIAEPLDYLTLSDLLLGHEAHARKNWAFALGLDPTHRMRELPASIRSVFFQQLADVNPEVGLSPSDPRIKLAIDGALNRLRLVAREQRAMGDQA